MIKGGDKAISTVSRRSSKGLELNVRLHEAVEEFFRASAGNEFTPVRMFGRKWVSPHELNVYDIPDIMQGRATINNTSFFRLDKPGQDIITIDSGGFKTLNMSFVRLVGASLDDGVTFSLSGAWSREDVIWLGSSITAAGDSICKQYIYPMIISTNNIIRTTEPIDQYDAPGHRTGVVPNGI